MFKQKYGSNHGWMFPADDSIPSRLLGCFGDDGDAGGGGGGDVGNPNDDPTSVGGQSFSGEEGGTAVGADEVGSLSGVGSTPHDMMDEAEVEGVGGGRGAPGTEASGSTPNDMVDEAEVDDTMGGRAPPGHTDNPDAIDEAEVTGLHGSRAPPEFGSTPGDRIDEAEVTGLFGRRAPPGNFSPDPNSFPSAFDPKEFGGLGFDGGSNTGGGNDPSGGGSDIDPPRAQEAKASQATDAASVVSDLIDRYQREAQIPTYNALQPFDWSQYGVRGGGNEPEFKFFEPVNPPYAGSRSLAPLPFAQGGIAAAAQPVGRVAGPGNGSGVDDLVGPVMLSKDEYVLPKAQIRSIGKGNYGRGIRALERHRKSVLARPRG